jgi:hypothetical protein
LKPEDEMDDVEFKQHVLEMKEKKFFKQRNPAQYYKEMSRYNRMKLALKMHLGIKGEVNPDLSEGGNIYLFKLNCHEFQNKLRSIIFSFAVVVCRDSQSSEKELRINQTRIYARTQCDR